MAKKIILWAILIILLAGNLFFGLKYFSVQKETKELKEAKEAKTSLESPKTSEEKKSENINGKIVDFTLLFIRKVLREKVEVSFETQMELDSEARNLGDEEILAQWQKFEGSQTEAEVLEEADNLLEMLVSKIKI